MAKPIALLGDGDVFTFQAAAASEYVQRFGSTYHVMAEFDAAQRHYHSNIKQIMAETKASLFINTLSCPSRRYWRHDVMPTYKAGRGKEYGVSGPICLADLKDWSAGEFETYRWKNMEADDVMGILATDPEFLPDYTKVIVSIDKDMKTIPTHIFNPDKDYQPWLQSKEDALLWFLAQAIGGDTTDGYSGVTGMSTESASAFLSSPWYWEAYDHTFKSGPRKGTSEERWRKAEPRSTWENILSLYAKSGQTEEEAIKNAQVARICHHEDYNQSTGELTLWSPDKL